jgi:hypothetical protein
MSDDKKTCPTCGHGIKGELGPWGRARILSGLSVRDVVAAVKELGGEISISTVSRADYDGSTLNLAAAAKLAKVYGVTLEAMVEA